MGGDAAPVALFYTNYEVFRAKTGLFCKNYELNHKQKAPALFASELFDYNGASLFLISLRTACAVTPPQTGRFHVRHRISQPFPMRCDHTYF